MAVLEEKTYDVGVAYRKREQTALLTQRSSLNGRFLDATVLEPRSHILSWGEDIQRDRTAARRPRALVAAPPPGIVRAPHGVPEHGVAGRS